MSDNGSNGQKYCIKFDWLDQSEVEMSLEDICFLKKILTKKDFSQDDAEKDAKIIDEISKTSLIDVVREKGKIVHIEYAADTPQIVQRFETEYPEVAAATAAIQST